MTTIQMFTMAGCAPCAVIKPKLQSLAQTTGFLLKLIDVTTNEGKAEMTRMGVITLPHVFVQRNTEGAVSFPPTSNGHYEAIERYLLKNDVEGDNTLLYAGGAVLLIVLTFSYMNRKKSI